MPIGDKLTELPEITSVDLDGKDPIYIVDDSADESKKLFIEELADWLDDRINTKSPFSLTATPGGSSSYTNPKSTVYLNWVGGPGTYNLTLPSATDIPYRTIQIISDGTLTANDKVHVLAPVGESIDGVINPGFYVLNKPYNGVKVWSDGTQWIVIQAKAI